MARWGDSAVGSRFPRINSLSLIYIQNGAIYCQNPAQTLVQGPSTSWSLDTKFFKVYISKSKSNTNSKLS